MHSFVPHISTTLTTPLLLLSLTRNEACRKNRSNRAGTFAFLRKRSSSSRVYIFFLSLSRCHARRPFTTTIDSRETLIYISAFEPFFVALDDVACAMRSRARSKKKRVWRRDAKTRRIRAREETGCERRDVGRAVPFRGGFRVLCFFSSNLLFWVFFVLVSCHHHHHLSMNNNEA